MKMKTYLAGFVAALLVCSVIAATNMVPVEVNRQTEPGVTDITEEIAPLVCEGITVSVVRDDVRPTYCDGPSRITADLKCDAIGSYTIHFEHPKGTNQPPIRLLVATLVGTPITNSFKVFDGCPTLVTNRQNDILVLEWRGIPGRGPSWAGWFFKGIKKE
jgi:hypothetical protein